MNIKNLTLGAWGCYTVDNSYSEIDFVCESCVGQLLLQRYLDYYNPIEGVKKNDFFNYNADTTRHLVDVNVKFHGTTNFPVYIMASTLIYGVDKKPNTTQNRYSTYFEAGYTLNEMPINALISSWEEHHISRTTPTRLQLSTSA